MTESSPAPSSQAPSGRRGVWIVIAVVLLALIGRAGAMLITHERFSSEDQAIARNLADRQGFSLTAFAQNGPTSARPPIYPILLATLYALAGAERGDVLAFGLNACFGAASAGLAYVLASRMGAVRCGAVLFAVQIAVWPTQLVAATYLQGLSLAILLTLATLCLATLDDVRCAIAAGLCAGLAMLTESILVLPLLVAIVWILRHRPAGAVLALSAALVLVGPWLYRNAIVHGRITGITTTMWSDVFQGNGDNATGSHLLLRNASGRPISRVQTLSPIETDQLKRQPETVRESLLRQWSLDWIATHPLAYARLCLIRIAKTLWTDWHHPLAFRIPNLAARSIALIVFGIGVVGAIRGSAFRPSMRLAIPMLAGVIVISGLTLAEARNAVFVDLAQLFPAAWFMCGRSA